MDFSKLLTQFQSLQFLISVAELYWIPEGGQRVCVQGGDAGLQTVGVLLEGGEALSNGGIPLV